jgi:hypothetical protein
MGHLYSSREPNPSSTSEKTQKPVTKAVELAAGQLPGNTALSYALDADVNAASVTLKVEVNTDVQIMNLIAVDLEGVVLVSHT